MNNWYIPNQHLLIMLAWLKCLFCSVIGSKKRSPKSASLSFQLCATRVTLGHGSICRRGPAAVPSLQPHSSGLHSAGQFPRVSWVATMGCPWRNLQRHIIQPHWLVWMCSSSSYHLVRTAETTSAVASRAIAILWSSLSLALRGRKRWVAWERLIMARRSSMAMATLIPSSTSSTGWRISLEVCFFSYACMHAYARRWIDNCTRHLSYATLCFHNSTVIVHCATWMMNKFTMVSVSMTQSPL